MARGYLNRPELTSARFIPDPFQPSPDARLYRTGDRARWRADGTLEFLGRTDDQVKLRGFRIEPGEIEAALTRLPWVFPGGGDAPRGPSRRASSRRLYRRRVRPAGRLHDPAAGLASSLPGYLIPSTFVRLGALPLTSSGKLDRGALPPPDPERGGASRAAHVPPRDETEAKLAALWSRVLGVSGPGIHDSFFEMGAFPPGHQSSGRPREGVRPEDLNSQPVRPADDRRPGRRAPRGGSPAGPARAWNASARSRGPALVVLPSVFGHCGGRESPEPRAALGNPRLWTLHRGGRSLLGRLPEPGRDRSRPCQGASPPYREGPTS